MYPLIDAGSAGPVLRALRKARGMTQAELGRRLGVSKGRVSAIERDPSGVALAQILAIVAELGARVMLDDRRLVRESPADAEW
ncbi:MAG: helix-turn-helix transcriptional regulator [Gemmatimonadaceae bacterium]|nr:helix-turn-helix transcriptional regulator [Gemmatimonadaceae bacterium]